MTTRQVELKFQNHIMDSYEYQGGKAAKWASEWQKGKPDLICALKPFPIHLMEVKHIPPFGPGVLQHWKNELTEKQKREAKEYIHAGGMVLAAVVGSSSNAIGSYLGLFNPLIDAFDADKTMWAKYKPGQGYDIRALISWMLQNAANS